MRQAVSRGGFQSASSDPSPGLTALGCRPPSDCRLAGAGGGGVSTGEKLEREVESRLREGAGLGRLYCAPPPAPGHPARESCEDRCGAGARWREESCTVQSVPSAHVTVVTSVRRLCDGSCV